MTTLEKPSPCKVNLLLNILGKRPDGFHELETIMHPVNVFDHLSFKRTRQGLHLTCSEPTLPTDSGNLVHRAATTFLQQAGITDGIQIHLEKRLPLAAGLGGGSGNAAITLLGLNELFGNPLAPEALQAIAASLGSDIPFCLQSQPALATGRGEKIQSLAPFPAMKGAAFLLIHPGFGISTAWAYQTLAQFPAALNGRPGRAEKLISRLQSTDLKVAGAEFYNSLEAPALEKYPLLVLFQEFLAEHGAAATLMSGSGSTTFALIAGTAAAVSLVENLKGKFVAANWTAVVPV
ncbi:MAG: 4-(cytidine 5'-diphospho)-2-C-methyl-D-erythritol kinase [Verrucomicrobiota bacterium]